MRNVIRAGLAILVWLSLLAPPAMSEVFGILNGNQLYDTCTGNETLQMHCIGYVAGVTDAMGLAKGNLNGWMACIPEGVTAEQLREVVKEMLVEHPETRHQFAAYLVARAVAEAFPCNP